MIIYVPMYYKDDEQGWCPDIPDGVRGRVNGDALPPDKARLRVDDKPHAIDWAETEVSDKHVELCKKRRLFSELPIRAKMMIAACKAKAWKKENITAHFDNIAELANASTEVKRAAKDVLCQFMAVRGLDSAHAETIRAKFNLERDTETSGTRDSQFLKCKYRYGLRMFGLAPTLAEVDADVTRGYLTEEKAPDVKSRITEWNDARLGNDATPTQI